MIRLWNRISANKLTAFTLIFIFLLGLFLRLYRLSDMTGWYDSARDYMVGQELWRVFIEEKFKIIPISPLAAGSAGALSNSPVYYYLIAVLTQLFSKPMAIAGFVGFLSSLTILVNFFIGKKLGGDRAGLVSAFFTAVSFVLINQSISVIQPNFLPFFISFFILSALLAYEKKSVYWGLVCVFVFWFFFHLHYSILLITPSFFWCFWQVFGRISQTKRSKLKILYLGCIFICSGLFWYVLTNANSAFDLASFLFGQISQGTNTNLYTLLQKIISVFLIFWSTYFWHLNYFLIGITFVVFLGLYIVGHFEKRNQDKFLESHLGLVFLSIGLLAVFKQTIDESYFVSIYTVMPLILAKLFQILVEWREMAGLIFLVVISSWLNYGNERLAGTQLGSYASSQLISEQILIDMNNKNITDLKMIFIASRSPELPVYDWTSPKYWYFLENQTGQKNTTLSYYFNNLNWNSDSPQVFYLVCEGYDLNQIKQVETRCLDPYLAKLGFIFEEKKEEMVLDKIGVKVFILQVRSELSIAYLWPFRVVDLEKVQ